MIYASDLDRTLIYSRTFLNQYTYLGDTILVDESKVNSYISADVAVYFKEVQSKMGDRLRFIPVTTRSIQEYTRIKFPFTPPEYAITTNGGTILHNNQKLPEWESYIQSEINDLNLEQIVEVINRLPGICYKTKIIDGKYVFSKTNNIDETERAIKKLNTGYSNCRFYMSKHKVYGVPNIVNKGKTLRWLANYLGEDEIVASGDSDFDVSMLQIADSAVLPLHNTISPKNKQSLKYVEIGYGASSPIETLRIIESLAGEIHILI